MKIVHVIFSLQMGGAENMLIDIINEQILHAEVSLYIVNNEINQTLLDRIDKTIKVKQFYRRAGSKNPRPIVLLNTTLLKDKPHIIHCHNHNMINILLPFFYKKTTLTIHDTGIESFSFKKYTQCFSISKAVQSDLYNRTNIITKVINNGVLLKAIIPATNEVKNKTIFRILQISRLSHLKKGQHIAIKALKIVKDIGFTNIQLDFIGEGDSENYLKQIVNNLGIKGQINFLGIKDRDYIYNNLQYYDLLVQPSFYEGFGLTIVEAMAANIPVLVSNIEGPMEIIEEGEYGYLFERGSISDLSQKIIEIMETKDNIIQRITEKAFIHVKRKYNVENTAINYLEEYKNITKKNYD